MAQTADDTNAIPVGIPVATPVNTQGAQDNEEPPVAAAVVATPVWPEHGFGPGTRQTTIEEGGLVVVRPVLVDTPTAEVVQGIPLPDGGAGDTPAPPRVQLGTYAWERWKDKVWAVVFLIHVALVFFVALFMGIPAVGRWCSLASAQEMGVTLPSQLLGVDESGLDAITAVVRARFALGVCCIVVPVVISLVWAYALQRHGACVLKVLLVAAAVLQVLVLLWSLTLFSPMFLLFGGGFMVAGMVYFYRWLYKRIPLAAATISTAIAAAHGDAGGSTPEQAPPRSTRAATYLMYAVILCLRLAWVVMWSLAALGVQWSFMVDEAGARMAAGVGTVASGVAGNNNGAQSAALKTSFKPSRRQQHDDGWWDDDDNDVWMGHAVAYLMLFFSLWWGIIVLRAIGSVTVAGVVGRWWGITTEPRVIRDGQLPARAGGGAPAGSQGCQPVTHSLFRACTVSLGSIVFGATILSLLSTLRAAVHLGRARCLRRLRSRRRGRSNNNDGNNGRGGRVGRAFGRGAGMGMVGALGGVVGVCVVAIFGCMARLLERVAAYLSRYAFVHIALTGQDFKAAARSTWDLFKARGWTAYATDRLVSRVLGFGMVVAALVSVLLLHFALLFMAFSSSQHIVVLLVGLVLALLMAGIIASVLDAASVAVFVCWAMDPVVLGETRPVEFRRQMAAWRDFRPDALRTAGLWNAGFATRRLGRGFFGGSRRPIMGRNIVPSVANV